MKDNIIKQIESYLEQKLTISEIRELFSLIHSFEDSTEIKEIKQIEDITFNQIKNMSVKQ